MDHQVVLGFEDGVTRFVACAVDETVAAAATRAKLDIPLDCEEGVCGTCRALCVAGEHEGPDDTWEALSADEIEQGYVLPCRLVPRGEVVLSIPTTSIAASAPVSEYRGVVRDVVHHSATTTTLVLEVDQRPSLNFLPGQYVAMTVPGTTETRCYSPCSAPEDELVSVLVRTFDGGLMSDYLRSRAAPGDQVEFAGPYGGFFLRDVVRPVLMVAGGTGLAPLLSMLRRLERRDLKHPVHMVYGVSRDEDLVYVDELHDCADRLPGFTFDYCVADRTGSAPNRGTVTSLLEPKYLHDGAVDLYACGPPAMVDAVHTHLAAEGVTPAALYYEKFTEAVSGAS